MLGDELRAPHARCRGSSNAIGLGKAWVEHDRHVKLGVLARLSRLVDRRRHLFSARPEARPNPRRAGRLAGGRPVADLAPDLVLRHHAEVDI